MFSQKWLSQQEVDLLDLPSEEARGENRLKPTLLSETETEGVWAKEMKSSSKLYHKVSDSSDADNTSSNTHILVFEDTSVRRGNDHEKHTVWRDGRWQVHT